MTSSSAGHDGLRDQNHDAHPEAEAQANAPAAVATAPAAIMTPLTVAAAAQQEEPPSDRPEAAAVSMDIEAVQQPAQEPRIPEAEAPATAGEQQTSSDAQSNSKGGDDPVPAAPAAPVAAEAAPPPTSSSSPSSNSAPAQQQTAATTSAPPAATEAPTGSSSANHITNHLSTPLPPSNPDASAETDNTTQHPPAISIANASGDSGESRDKPAFVEIKTEDVTMVDAPIANATIAAAVAETQLHASAMPAPQMSSTEQFQPSTPYAPQAAIDHRHAYMMMALASMSAAPPAMSPPPTVTPSQVTLPNIMGDGYFGLGSANNSLRQPGPGADMGLESFARVEFADSVFQMTTYAVIIGRDQRALEQARRDEKRAEEYKRRAEENASNGLPPPSPIVQDRHKFSKSYVSEEGGMLGPESDSEENGRPTKRRKTSTTGSSHEEVENSQDNVISNRQYVSHTPGAAAVDLTSLRPSPWHVPFIGIHSPGPNIASKTKAISREHLKIAYNQAEGVFEAIPLHKNGFFCEDVHYKSEKVVLRCGDRLQIKDIDFRFIINGVEKGRTGAEEYQEEDAAKTRHSHGGKSMSFDFEQSHGNGQIQDTSDELSDVEVSPAELSDFGEDDEEEGDEEEAEEAEEEEGEGEGDGEGDGEDGEDGEDGDLDALEASIEGDSEIKDEGDAHDDPSMPQMARKRGPGRPPKNGIMSKREQRLLKKQQQEMAKKTLPQAPLVEPPLKRKVGRPRKHPLPEDGTDRPEKRKYKPRKPKNEDGVEGSDAERRAREKKEKKSRPKSPPLELKIEDYTEEQLQKPNKNYGVLIDETLTAAGPDGLTLKQIYKRICQRYPWFYFHTETKGWESSVRHNLIGNEAFKKDETTNLWSRVPGVELDAGKKRKAASPDRGLVAAQAYGHYSYPYAAQHMAPSAHHGYPPGQTPAPGYQAPAYAGQPAHAARPVQYGASQSPPIHQPVQPAQPVPVQPVQPVQQVVGAPPPAPIQLPGYGPPAAPARPQLGVALPGAYSSPYASRPPPLTNPPVKAEDGGASIPSAAAVPGQRPISAASAESKPVVASTSHQAVAQAGIAHPTPARPSATPARPIIEPRLLTAVVGLKNGLVENLKKAGNPKAEAIVMSALNRCIGLKKEATENDKMEAICIKGIRQVIDGFTKGKSPTPSGSTPLPTDTPPVFESKVLAALNGLKEASVNAIKAGLGAAKAEAVTLSAIDRVIGLADASIMPKAAEGEPVSNFEGVEQHLMKSIRQLLQGMNQKLQGDS